MSKDVDDVDDKPIGTEVEEVADALSSQMKSKKTSRKHKPIQQKMLQWAISGFPPTGPGGFQPTREVSHVDNYNKKMYDVLFL